MKIIITGLIFLACISVTLAAKKPPHHILILGLDGISYQTVLKMHESGFFREFQRPIPMVATFPSISDPNWAHLTGSPVEKGYTKAGYTLTKNKDGSVGTEYGTLIDHLTTPPQYEKWFDFKPEGVFQHIMSMTWTETSALFWSESLSRYLLNPQNIKSRNTSKAFIVNTDIISHVGGEGKVIDYLKELDKKIQKLRVDFKNEYKKNLEVILVTDHGNHFKKATSIDYKKHFEKKGFFQKTTLKEKTDYAFVAPEIIAFGAFYVLPGEEDTFGKEFSQVENVHVAITKNNSSSKTKNIINVYSKDGISEITIDTKKNVVSYRLISGSDPFEQIQLFKNKSELTFDDYFYRTLNSDYPNALVRAWEGLYKNSQEPASVLVSPKLGYVFTNLTLEILTAVSGVKSTHGSFHREESLGLIMTTLPGSQEASTSFQFNEWIKKL